MERRTLTFARYLPSDLRDLLAWRADDEYEILNHRLRAIATKNASPRNEQDRVRYAQLHYRKTVNCLQQLASPSDQMEVAVRLFGFGESQWDRLINAVIFADWKFSDYQLALKRSRMHVHNLMELSREMLEVAAKLDPELERLHFSVLETGRPLARSFWKIENIHRRLQGRAGDDSFYSRTYLDDIINELMDVRQQSKKTGFIRALGYYLTLPYGNGGEGMIELSVATKKGIVHVSNLMLNDPDNEVTYDDVRKAIKPEVIEKNRISYRAWREREMVRDEERRAERVKMFADYDASGLEKSQKESEDAFQLGGKLKAD